MGKKRVVGYIRTGLNADSKIHIEYIKAEFNKHPDWELVEIYLDKGSSGMDNTRSMFRKMIEDGKAKKFDYVICKSKAKFSRDFEMGLAAIEELKQSGIGVYFLEENIDTFSEGFNTYAAMIEELKRVGLILGKQEWRFAVERKKLSDDEELDENELAIIENIEI